MFLKELTTCHGIAIRMIKNLRTSGIMELNERWILSSPQHNSWRRDIAVILELLVGVGIPLYTSQQDTYQRILRMIDKASHGHLFHYPATMTKGFS
jgi:hypothetical protein